MKLSIITINRNNASGLKKTIESVVSQSFTDFEYIVIDGASTDESVDIIKSYSDKISYWVSEPDSGIYNAMNKGLRVAHGEYTLMLNSGDFLVNNDVVQIVLPLLDGTDIIQGNIIEDHNAISYRNKGYGKSKITFIDAMDGIFLHQASFCHKSLYDRFGYFEEEYKKGADTYFFTRCLALGDATYKYIDIDIANFDITGISAMTDPKWIEIDRIEDEKWYGTNIPQRLMDFYKEAPKKIKLYDVLHQYKIVWKLAMLLVKIVLLLAPEKKKVIKEKI